MIIALPASRTAAIESRRTSAAALACILALALFSPVAHAAEEPVDATGCIEIEDQPHTASFRFEDSPRHQALARSVPEGVPIGSIRFTRFAVFDLEDPSENNKLYRWANDFHWTTRESVLRDHLLVGVGDPYHLARNQESERILRDLKFIYDARVRPWRWCGDTVDLEVVTRDNWTFLPSVDFNRSGGANEYALGFRDSNFLGTGKQVKLSYEKDDERAGTTLGYGDPALFGTRWRMRLNLTENDDGHNRLLQLNRPFFSLYETWSAGGLLEDQKLEEKVWFRGDEIAEFDHEQQQVQVFGGVASDTQEGRGVKRWLFGYHYQTHEFDFSDSDIPPPELPPSRDYSYPYIGFQSIEDEYIEVHRINYLGRTEDLYIGERYEWNLGWSGESLGGTRDQVYLLGEYGNTLLVNYRDWWAVDTWLSGFWNIDDGEFENLWWTGESRYHRRQRENWALFARLRLDYTEGLTLDNQLTLGGDNGLRGYDRNYQTGDRAFVFNLEQRYYSDWHLFNLIRVGVAAFFDVGRAWFKGRDNGSNGDVLANAGVGLRFTSSRASKSSMLHLDLAFPFMKDDDVDDYQLLITVKDRF